jgi:hypothetical protein
MSRSKRCRQKKVVSRIRAKLKHAEADLRRGRIGAKERVELHRQHLIDQRLELRAMKTRGRVPFTT